MSIVLLSTCLYAQEAQEAKEAKENQEKSDLLLAIMCVTVRPLVAVILYFT